MRTMGLFAANMPDVYLAEPREKRPAEQKRQENAKQWSLPCWNFGGSLVYARNEKEAIKRAKKRGIYCDNFHKV